MSHPLLDGLVRQAKLNQFHSEANALLTRIAKLVPGAKLTLLIRSPEHTDGERDILLTDDNDAASVHAAIDKLWAKEPQ